MDGNKPAPPINTIRTDPHPSATILVTALLLTITEVAARAGAVGEAGIPLFIPSISSMEKVDEEDP